MIRRDLFILLPWFLAFLVSPGQAVADCSSLNMTKGVDLVARSLLSGSTLLFVGKIKSEQFVGNISSMSDLNSDASVDVTYSVEQLFKGQAGSTIKLRTPFFCEDCSISNETELKTALDADLEKRVIVYVFEEVDDRGYRRRIVSGGCPESIDANPYGLGNDLVLALQRAVRKGR